MKTNSDGVLERFMKEFFPFTQFKNIGFFTKEMKGDYEAQAKKVCDYFGYKTVYEYGAVGCRVHLSLDRPITSINEKGELEQEPFVTVIKSIYE